MSFQNDDLFLVNRSGDSFKTEYAQLKQSINEENGVHVDDNPPINPNDGDLWFNSDEGRLYVWYVSETTGIVTGVSTRNGGSGYTTDANDVETSGGSGTGLTVNVQAGIGGNFANPTVNQSGHSYKVGDVVFVTGAGHGNGSVSVTSVNTSPVGQWVVTTPDGGIDGSDFVSKTDTNLQNIVSDLTLGTDKITLDATNGSAEFASDVSIGPATANNSETIKLTESGYSHFSRTLLSEPCRLSFNTSAGEFIQGSAFEDSPRFLIKSDGSAKFTGYVQSGGEAKDGTADGVMLRDAGLVQVSRTGGSNAVYAGYQTGSAIPTTLINADGSASFADNITMGGTLLGTGNLYAGYVDQNNFGAKIGADGTAQFKGIAQSEHKTEDTDPDTTLVTKSYVDSKNIVTGSINQPTVVAPADGAGSGVTRDIVTDAITNVEGGGIKVCETELIESVDVINYSNGVALTPGGASWQTTDTEADKIFDGKLNTCASSPYSGNDSTDGFTVTFTPGLTGEIVIGMAQAGGSRYYSTNGNTRVNIGTGPGQVAINLGTFTDVNPLNTLKLTSSNESGGQGSILYYVQQDGVVLVEGDTTLTFPSAQDFDCFEPGDVVQGGGTQLGDTYGCNAQNLAIVDPTTVTFSDTSLGEAPSVGVNTYSIYADFGTPTKATFGSIVVGSGSCQMLMYWNGSDWILDDKRQGSISTDTSTWMYGTTKARYWLSVRLGCGLFDAFNVGDVIKNGDIVLTDNYNKNYFFFTADPNAEPDVKVISKDDSDPFTVTVDGGDWTATDGSGTPDEQDKLTKQILYDTKLTLAGAKDLNVLKAGDVVKMGMDVAVPYKPVSDSIVSVDLITVDTVNKLFKGDFTAGNGFKFVGFYDASNNPVVVPEPDYVSIPPSQKTANPFTNPVGYTDGNAGWFWDAATLGAGKNVVLSWDTPIDKVITQARIGGFVGGNTVIAVWSMSGGLEAESTFNTISNIGAQPIIDVIHQREVTTLTLSGDTDLAYFRLGDVVQLSTAGNIIATTDAGDFFSDPDATDVYGNIDAVFAPGLNPGFTLIMRDNAWEEFTFLNPPTVTSTIQFQGGNASTGNRNFALYINGQSMINPLYGVNEWDTSGSYATPAVVSFAGVMNSLRIQAINGVPGGDGVGVANICVDGFDDASKITGTAAESQEVKIVSIDDTVPSITVDGGEWDPTGVTGDSEVTCQSPLKAPTDWTIEAIEGNTLSLSHATPDDSAQVWVANDNQAGTDFFVEPTNAIPIEQDYAWAKLQIINNKAQVTGIQKDDPGFLPVPAKDYSIKFPALFPTGNEPDVDLPKGTCVATIVAAENSEGRSVKESNCFMPIDVNPAGAAGPITATTPTTLTVASNANLSSFSPGDNLVMVDENNDISDYTIVSDSIASVVTIDTSAYEYKAHSAIAALNTLTWDSVDLGPATITSGVKPNTGWSNAYWVFIKFNGPAKVNWGIPNSGTTKTVSYFYSHDGVNWVFDSSYNQSSGNYSGPFSDSVNSAIYWAMSYDSGTDNPLNLNSVPSGGLVPDNWYQYTIPEANIILTLSGDTDLAYFRPGDVVQSDAIVGDFISKLSTSLGTISDESKNNAFDGDINTECLGGDAVSTLTLDLSSSPINYTSSVEIYTESPYDEGRINDNAFVDMPQNAWTTLASGSGIITKIQVKDDTAKPAWTAIKVDGKYLIDASLFTGNEVKVISKDDTVPSITVDGGEWDTSNQSQVWSAGADANWDLPYTNGNVYPASNLFDGDLTKSGFCGGANQGFITMNINVTEKLRFKGYGGPSIWTVTLDGQSVPVPFTTTGGELLWVDVPGTGQLTRIANNNKGGAVSAIEVDGKILVDAVNDSQVWSSVVTTGSGMVGDVTAAFNGAASPNFGGTLNNTECWIEFPDASTLGGKKVEIYSINGNTKEQYWSFTQGTGDLQRSDLKPSWTDLGVAPANQTRLYCYGSTNPYFTMIRVEGKLLVDRGVRDFGDSEVTTGPVTGTGVFQSADLNANTMTLSVSNDRWIDNNNRLSRNFYVRDNITVLNADNPKHVAMQQAIADAFNAFPEKVNDRRTAIASSFYRLTGGETLTAEEFALLEETVTNAVNATEPFALDGYYPLYYTSAKADAASSEDSHHTHTINGVTYYMPDGGTLYHGTYIS